MIRFDEIKYERPDYEALKVKLQQTVDIIEKSSDLDEIEAAVLEFNREREHCETMGGIVQIRSYLDGTNETYAKELMEIAPASMSFDVTPLFDAIAKSPYKEKFEEKYGTFLLEFQKKKAMLYTAGEEFVAEEQNAITELHQFVSEMKFEFDGEMISESRLAIFRQDDDEEVRMRATYADKKAYVDNGKAIGDYYRRIVKARNKIARANGFDNYLDYVNVSKARLSYGEKELQQFCDNVRKYIVPIIVQNNEVIRKRFGLEVLNGMNAGRCFPDGPAKPLVDTKALIEKGQEMFDDLDPEFGDIYRRMNENHYFDIDLSDTKVTGIGFTADIVEQKIPYIFGNYLKTASTLTTFLHECGHAMQVNTCLNKFDIIELHAPVQDIVEVPSKTMELFSHAYAEKFFGKDAEKYIIGHTTDFLSEIGTYCMAHELETYLYNNEDADMQEWIEKFNELSNIYSPGIEPTLPDLHKQGADFFGNANLFSFPRYVISYSLCSLTSTFIAAEFEKDKAKGVEFFKRIAGIGGNMDYATALTSVGLKPGYDEEVIKESAEYLKKQLNLG
jgi:M3 family oligoendopeptidase